jgi:hypothetical protein
VLLLQYHLLDHNLVFTYQEHTEQIFTAQDSDLQHAKQLANSDVGVPDHRLSDSMGILRDRREITLCPTPAGETPDLGR